MNNLIEVKSLCKNYAGFSLDNVTFSVPKGYIMGFIGPNGAGKTTTIKSILGMVASSGGEVTLFGEKMSTDSPQLKEDIGVVMDLPFYVDDWKVKDVESAISPFYSKWNHDTFESLVRKFGIDKNKKVKELSRGMKVKLMLELVEANTAGGTDDEVNDTQYAGLSAEIQALQMRLKELDVTHHENERTIADLDEILTAAAGMKYLAAAFDDKIVRQMIACVKVVSSEKLLVIFKRGLEKEVEMI